MKKIILLLSAILMGVQSTLAQDAASLLMGYCGESPYTSMTLGGKETEPGHSISHSREQFVAVQFDEDFVSRFAGCRVTAVRVCLGGSVPQTAGVWITEELPAEVPYMTDANGTQTCDFVRAAQFNPEAYAYHFPYEAWIDTRNGGTKIDPNYSFSWKEAQLQKPYTISADKPFYAGYRAFAAPGGVGGQVIALENGGAAGTDDHSWVYFPESENHWCPLAQTSMAQFNVGLMIQVRIEGDALPKNNVAMAAINGSEYVTTAEPLSLECVMQNKGVNKLMSFDMTYSIDGVSQGTKTMKFTNGLEYNQYGGFKLDGITFSEPGAHTITVTATRPNGEEDTQPSDDTMTKTITVYAAEVSLPRRVLVETFTGITCGNCPGAHEREEEAFEGTDAIIVTHHAGFYADELTLNASVDLTWFYNNGGGTFAPAIMMDRTNVNGFYKTDYPGPVFYPGEPEGLRNVHTTLKKIPTTVDVKLQASYDPATRQLTVTATGDVLATPAGDDHRINVWLTESGIKAKAKQSGSSLGADYIHNNVLRALLTTSSWGDKIDLTGTTYTRTYTTTLNSKWNPENMEIVAFLGNIDGADPTNCRVLNADNLRLADIMTNGIGTVSTDSLGAVEYYSLSGQRLTAPTSGVTLMRTTAPDGNVQVLKRLGK